MKKSKYIGKYDYIGYYTKQKAMWFYSNAEILSGIQNETNILSNGTKQIDIYDEDDEETDDESYKYDCYEKYREMLSQNMSLDDDDPKIIEGRIIDKQTKKYILETYKYQNYVDFDDELYRYKTMEELANITKKTLLENEKCIIFQPVFIYKNLITRCDALVKNSNEIHVIETKATSSSKLYHYLDLFYQKNILESQDYLLSNNFNYSLCLIEYEKCKKFMATFVIVNYFNITKNITQLSKKNKEELTYDEIIEAKRMLKQGYIMNGLNNFESGISFNRIMNNEFNEIIEKKEKQINKIDFFNKINLDFWNVIEQLQEWKDSMKNDIDMPHNFTPSIEDNSDFKKSSFWNELKTLYILKGFDLFKYSGYVVNQSKNGIEYLISTNQKKMCEEFIQGSNKNKTRFENCFLRNEKNINQANCQNLLNELKDNKVYFDFETINTAIRSLDNTLPFSQIITQCSIIKSSKKDITEWQCENLVCDPKKITISFMKEIVDKLFKGNNTSYIVYNKNFEKSRLLEASIYINEKEYSKKIQIIVSNLFDLADFFDCRKDYILLPELYGFYSIKKVLALIEKLNPKIFDKCKCKDYKGLNVKNGGICQQKTTKRFFDMLDDQEWKILEKDLKIYCENDVRAMIAVELFIKDLLYKNNDF